MTESEQVEAISANMERTRVELGLAPPRAERRGCSEAQADDLLAAAVAARAWILSLPRDIKMSPYDRRAGAAAYNALDTAITKTKEGR